MGDSYADMEAEAALKDRAATRKFPVIELFGPTIQGEGSVIGMQTMFARFGGCDYRCERCDSLHAVLPPLIKQNATAMTAGDIIQKITAIAGHCRMLTLSGGNPCMWDLSALVTGLRAVGWQIAVETQGTLWQDWLLKCDYVTVSPKGPGMGEKFELDKFLYMMNQFIPTPFSPNVVAIKVVIFDQRDIEFVKEIAQLQLPFDLYLSLGNPYPPSPAMRDPIDESIPWRDVLCTRMKVLYEDIAKEPLLAKARFLPQLHTLLWGNDQCR